jgi:hypothetical protein
MICDSNNKRKSKLIKKEQRILAEVDVEVDCGQEQEVKVSPLMSQKRNFF